ncbi:MAG: homoserine dehydrogenase, partial [Phycisphaerae bacterium]|nr:homoserine dehydrogenase [Phycisphaerae bacterium]
MAAKKHKPLGIAIVGCGTVGGATAALLTTDRNIIESKVTVPMELRYIVDVDFSHAREMGLDESLFTDSIDAPIGDADVQVIV